MTSLLTALKTAERDMDLHRNAARSSRTQYHLKKLARHPLRSLRLGIKGDGVACTFFGSKMYVPLSDVNAADLYYAGCLRQSESSVTRFLLNTLKPHDVFYDVGANYGFYSSLAESLGAETHAFEPSAHCRQYLTKNVPSGFVSPNALWDEICELEFYDTSVSHKSGMSTLVKEIAIADPLKFKKRIVSADTLDNYVKTHNPPTIMKLDTQATEARVLQGGIETLTVHNPVIVLELWTLNPHAMQNSRDVLELLGKLGYSTFVPDEAGDIIPTTVDLEHMGENNNIVFIKSV